MTPVYSDSFKKAVKAAFPNDTRHDGNVIKALEKKPLWLGLRLYFYTESRMSIVTSSDVERLRSIKGLYMRWSRMYGSIEQNRYRIPQVSIK